MSYLILDAASAMTNVFIENHYVFESHGSLSDRIKKTY